MATDQFQTDHQPAAETTERTAGQQAGPRRLTIGNITSYVVGVFSLIIGITTIFTAPVTALALVAAGVFVLPPTRRMLEAELNIAMSRWFVFVGYFAILAFGAALVTL